MTETVRQVKNNRKTVNFAADIVLKCTHEKWEVQGLENYNISKHETCRALYSFS